MSYLEYKKLLIKADKSNKNGVLCDNSIIKIINQKKKLYGIYGGGISLLSKSKKSPILLYAPEIQKKLHINKDFKTYEFINTPYNNIKWFVDNANYFIDTLFFLDRSQNLVPEYINIINSKGKNKFEYDFEFNLRINYQIIHCSVEEIKFFTLCWVSIMKIISFNNLNTKLKSLILNSSSDLISKFNNYYNSLEFNLLKFYNNIKLNYKGDKVDESIINSVNYFITNLFNNFDKIANIFTKNSIITEYMKNVTNIQYNFENYELKSFIEYIIKIFELNNESTIFELLQEIHKSSRFPIIPYVFLLLLDINQEDKEHLVFPIWNTYSKYTAYNINNNQKEYSVMHGLYTIKPFWYLNNNKDKDNTKSKINKKFKSQLINIIKLINSLSKPIIDKEYYGKQLKADLIHLEKQAIRTAIAKVFLRNMSHNIGSHVLSRLISPKLIDSNVITKEHQYKSTFDFIQQKSFSKSKVEDFKKCLEKHSIPIPQDIVISDKEEYDYDLELVSYFNSYLKSRMDFLADLVTGVPQIQNIKFFKEDLIKGFDKNRILLNRISGLDEDFKFTIEIKFPKDKPDLLVAISNDILGQHAFYIILENIIRNTAKHGFSKNKDQESITFTINIENSKLDNSLYKIQIYDNIERSKTDNTKIVNDLNQKINDSILKEDFSLREGALGIIEMLVSAAYIRKIPIEEVNDKEFKILTNEEEIKKSKTQIKNKEKRHKIIRAIPVENTYLGYQIYIPKPKELLIIDETDIYNSIDIDKIKELESNGILFLHTSDNKNDNYKYNEDENYDHSALLVISEEYNLSKYEDNLNLPYRKLSFQSLKENYNNFHEVQLTNFHEVQLTNELFIKKLLVESNSISDIIVEVWRALAYNKFIEKGLNPKNQNFYRPFLNINNTNEYNLSIFHHGTDYSYNDNKKVNYCEVITSEFTHLRDIIKKDKDENPTNSDLVTKFKFLYSSITNILVLDERIQEQAARLTYSSTNTTYRDLWDNTNVYIPEDKEIDLNARSFGNNYSYKIIDIIKKEFYNCERTCKNLDIILIHLGVIEKILKAQNQDKTQNTSDIENFIDELNKQIKDIKANSKVKIVITSGRGQPDNIPENIPFLNYSIISQYLIEQRFKLFLAEVLYISKRRSK